MKIPEKMNTRKTALVCVHSHSMKSPLEKTLYPFVKRWMKRQFVCFKAGINKGLWSYCIADIVGVRDVGGELSGDVETIIIEVKRGKGMFARACGQTLSYNVYANRVYLADKRPKKFTPEELQVASHLGIGLIQIRDHTCTEVLSSPLYTPIRRLNLRLLEKLGIGRCQLCDSIFETGTEEDPWLHMVRADEDVLYVVKKAIDQRKGLMFWKMKVAERKRKLGLADIEKGESEERRFICSECVMGILAVDPDRIKGWLKDYVRANALSFS